MPLCPRCNRRVWLWRSNLYGAPCKDCWKGEPPEERLKGTWRSDADRTVAEWREHRPLTDEQAGKLRNFFGKLRVTYSDRSVAYDFSGMSAGETDRLSVSGPFSVVARDASSVVINSPVPGSNLRALVHLRFCDSDTYWVQSDLSPLREYFTREPTG